MGEYFSWVNVDKREYICPADFDFGLKRTESLVRGTSLLCALKELLSDRWKGDHIAFFGDEFSSPEDVTNPFLNELYRQIYNCEITGDFWDMICEEYRNVSCFFNAAEESVREGIEILLKAVDSNDPYLPVNEYGVDLNRPFDGLFQKTGRDFRYTINYTKRVCYSFEKTKILCLNRTECDYADPLPLLMCCGGEPHVGPWLGDVVGVADEKPEGFTLLNEVYLDW